MNLPNIDEIVNEVRRQHIKDLEAASTPDDRQACLTLILEKMFGMPVEATLSIPDCRYISFMLQKDVDLGVCEHYSIEKRLPSRIPEHNDYDEFCSYDGKKLETTCPGGFATSYCAFLKKPKV